MMRQYLRVVVRFSADADIYIADNASTDNSVEMLRAEFPMCKLILFDCNWGFAEGYNKALKNIDAEYFILLNSDIEVTAGWLKPIVSYMDANPDVAACQPKIMSIHNRRCFEYAGACGGFVDKYGYPFCRGRIFDVVEVDTGQYDSVICSFALHLCPESMLPTVLWNLSEVSDTLVVISPNKRPYCDNISGWIMVDETIVDRVRMRIYCC